MGEPDASTKLTPLGMSTDDDGTSEGKTTAPSDASTVSAVVELVVKEIDDMRNRT